MRKLLTDLAKVLSMQFVVLLLIVGLSALGYYFRKDILISYHKWGQESAIKSARKYSSQATKNQYNRYEEKFQRHQKALIDLGYLEERTFNTKYLTAFTPEFQKMLLEFRERHPRCSYSVGDRQNHKIWIAIQKDLMPVMEELITKYDVPPDDPNEK